MKSTNEIRAALLHLGSNFWDDFEDDPDGWAKSLEEELRKPNPYGTAPKKKRSRYHSYLRCREDLWRQATDRAAALGYNTLFIDLGEGVKYPSHPELAVAGSWSVEKLRAELARLRAMGITPLPKLNFSACHDAWLKEYHRMLSTPTYYRVVADLIKDVGEIFDHPALFHIGYDEEFRDAQFNHFHVTVRQHDLWWHDLLFTVGEVERIGSRAVMWSDKCWVGRNEFVKRMPKSVLQMNWYYRSDFSPKKLQWDWEWEKRGGWGETVHGAATFEVLEKAGFDQLPCCSNWAEDGCSAAVVDFCRAHIDESRLKGFCTAPWAFCVPVGTPDTSCIDNVLRGLDLLAETWK